jgi:hypothetical protein
VAFPLRCRPTWFCHLLLLRLPCGALRGCIRLALVTALAFKTLIDRIVGDIPVDMRLVTVGIPTPLGGLLPVVEAVLQAISLKFCTIPIIDLLTVLCLPGDCYCYGYITF